MSVTGRFHLLILYKNVKAKCLQVTAKKALFNTNQEKIKKKFTNDVILTAIVSSIKEKIQYHFPGAIWLHIIFLKQTLSCSSFQFIQNLFLIRPSLRHIKETKCIALSLIKKTRFAQATTKVLKFSYHLDSSIGSALAWRAGLGRVRSSNPGKGEYLYNMNLNFSESRQTRWDWIESWSWGFKDHMTRAKSSRNTTWEYPQVRKTDAVHESPHAHRRSPWNM